MTSARSNADNEFLASSSLGIRPVMLYLPFIILGILFSVGSFLLNDWSMPRAGQEYRRTYAALVQKTAKIEITPYSINKYGDKLLISGAADDASQGQTLRSLLIVDQGRGYNSNIITASNVGISFSADSLAAILRMQDSFELRSEGNRMGEFSISTAQAATLRIQIQAPMQNYGSTAPSEMSTITLSEKISEKKQARNEKARKQSQIARTYDKLCLAYDAGEYKDAESFALSLNALQNQKIVDTSLQIYRLELQKNLLSLAHVFSLRF